MVEWGGKGLNPMGDADVTQKRDVVELVVEELRRNRAVLTEYVRRGKIIAHVNLDNVRNPVTIETQVKL